MIEIDGTDELNIQFAILNLMSDQRIWTNAELKSKLAKTLPLMAHDRLRSKTRPTEAVWENRVNNALSLRGNHRSMDKDTFQAWVMANTRSRNKVWITSKAISEYRHAELVSASIVQPRPKS